jgi:MFS family permease
VLTPVSTTSPLRIQIFRKVWLASLASNFGGVIQSVGASWMMTSLAGSAQLVSLVQTSTTLPIMLLSLLAGAVADNFDRRVVMLWAQAFMFLLSVALAICAWSGVLTPWSLLTFTFLIGCGTALNSPAWKASIADMVPRPVLSNAVALNGLNFNIARSVGPGVGGAIVAAAGTAAAFVTNALTYMWLILVLARWRPHYPPRTLPPEPLGVAMGAGIRYVAMSPNLRIVLLRGAVFGFAACAVPALMPLVARDLLGGGPITYGVLLGAFGAGAVGGALISGWLHRRLSTEWIVRMASAAFGIATATAAFSEQIALTATAMALAGAGWLLALSILNSTVQLAAPRWVAARGIALYHMATFGGMAAGSWIFGVVAGYHGISISLLAAAILQVLSTLIGLRLPLPQVADLNLDPLQQWKVPETAVPVEEDSGPIVISIEYRIAQEDIVAFLKAMHEQRRIRRRDGAHQWTLLRSLSEPELWIERYQVPTWVDYARHNERRTHDDASIRAQILALHRGARPLRVHRLLEQQTGSLPTTPALESQGLSDPLTDPSQSS